jgi:hypothetical protein
MRKMLAATTVALLAFATLVCAQDAKTFLVGKTVSFAESRSLPYWTADQVAFENVLVNGDHYIVVMRFKNEKNAAKFEPVSYLKLPTVQVPVVDNSAIVIDGNASDWDGITPAMSDPANDIIFDMYYGTPGTDMADVYLAHDDYHMYFRMTLFNGGPLINAMYVIELQQYQYQIHTPGDVSAICVIEDGVSGRVDVWDRNGRHVATHPRGAGYCRAGAGWLEWKVGLDELRSASPLEPYFPAAPKDRGIENRSIRTYIHPGGGGPVSDEYDRGNQKLIVDFYAD